MSKTIPILIAVCAATVLRAAPLSQDEINDLVQRLQTVYQNRTSLQANFREERHVAILKEPVVNQGKIWFTPPDKIRREIGGDFSAATVIDGKKKSIYYSKLKKAGQKYFQKRTTIQQSLEAAACGLDFS